MGYSCAAKASYTRKAIETLIAARYGADRVSNYVPFPEFGGFFEIGRETQDGAIVGSVYKTVDAAGHCRRSGGFRIDACGKVARFPGVPRDLLDEAEIIGAREYKEIHEPEARPMFEVIETIEPDPAPPAPTAKAVQVGKTADLFPEDNNGAEFFADYRVKA